MVNDKKIFGVQRQDITSWPQIPKENILEVVRLEQGTEVQMGGFITIKENTILDVKAVA